ncbi:Kiwa anti-phage protein KwaB-like domain-containing protein [Microbacterium sp. A8/3-1]|uniref:Kiwa anti-phage protein KwaB-like domain-containing protein n=1 Tax=Microbacterium sp. A8/3-1 TaxID=3160749 RepID=A0AAU7VRS2_9MICO
MTTEEERHVLTDALNAEFTGLDNFVLRGDAIVGADLSRFELVDYMATGVANDVRRRLESLSRKQFLDYDPSYQTSTSQVLVEKLSEIPELAVTDAAVRRGDAPYDAGGHAVVAMAHAVGTGTNRIVAYRMKGPGIVTRRSRGVTLIPRDGIYRPIGDDVLFYEPNFDVFTCAGFAYFTTATLIQTKLHAPEKARQLARQTLASVTAKIRIDGFPQLEQAVMDDPSMRAKMAYVARLMQTDPDYAKNLTTRKLVAFVEAYPDYDIRISIADGKKALRFDPSPQHRHQIPRLLADDYLHSYLTNRNYEAGSKQRAQT